MALQTAATESEIINDVTSLGRRSVPDAFKKIEICQNNVKLLLSVAGQFQARVIPKGTSKRDPALAFSEIINDVA